MVATRFTHEATMPDRKQEFKAQLERNGLSIADWARARDYNVRTVYAVLNGQVKARRGIGHRIAVDAGLKQRTPKVA